MKGILVKFNFPLKALKGKRIKVVLLILLVIVFLFLTKSFFVAALVNGWPVSRIAVIEALEKQGGSDVLNTLVEKSLIFQEARRLGVKVSDEAVNQQIASIEEILKGQNLTLEDALAARGQTKEDLVEQIRIQKTVEAILSQKINVSEEDIAKYFEENKELLEEGAVLEELTEDIRSQLFQQKLNDEYQKWINELKAKAKILYFVNFP